MSTVTTIEEADEVIESLKSMLITARTERDRLKLRARRVILCHDIGTLSKAPGDSVAIEALRELVKE
jgi:hypothetical protein